jgi:hypothetical protein
MSLPPRISQRQIMYLKGYSFLFSFKSSHFWTIESFTSYSNGFQAALTSSLKTRISFAPSHRAARLTCLDDTLTLHNRKSEVCLKTKHLEICMIFSAVPHRKRVQSFKIGDAPNPWTIHQPMTATSYATGSLTWGLQGYSIISST